MSESDRSEVTQILLDARAEADPPRMDRLFDAVYVELRGLANRIMQGERVDHTLQPTALVNEAYMRLVDATKIDVQGRTHFLRIAARAMRQVLVDAARKRDAKKRGGDQQRVTLHDWAGVVDTPHLDAVDLESALTRLGEQDERAVSVVELRVFAGLKMEEIASVLGVTRRTVQSDWRFAQMWLRAELSGSLDDG